MIQKDFKRMKNKDIMIFLKDGNVLPEDETTERLPVCDIFPIRDGGGHRIARRFPIRIRNRGIENRAFSMH